MDRSEKYIEFKHQFSKANWTIDCGQAAENRREKTAKPAERKMSERI